MENFINSGVLISELLDSRKNSKPLPGCPLVGSVVYEIFSLAQIKVMEPPLSSSLFVLDVEVQINNFIYKLRLYLRGIC
jgi:hypothetical protein